MRRWFTIGVDTVQAKDPAEAMRIIKRMNRFKEIKKKEEQNERKIKNE